MAIIDVSNGDQLSAALAAAKGGDTIVLEGGDYGDVILRQNLMPNLDFDKTVTVMSADPDRPAVFSSMALRDVSNIAFDGIEFNLETDASTSISVIPFRVDNSQGVTIRNSTFSGDDYKGPDGTKDDAGAGYGLRFLRSDDVSIENSEFSGFQRAITATSGQNVRIVDNNIHDISGDAIKISEFKGVLIEGNRVTDFRSNPNDTIHRDMIQFHTYGTTTPSTDIVIRSNMLHNGSGPFTQSIFLGNEEVARGGAGTEMYFRDILIEDNVVFNASPQGISVGATNGLTIRNNTVLHNAPAGNYDNAKIPKIMIDERSRDVAVVSNITHSEPDRAHSSWTVSDNFEVQRTDPLGTDYYGALFVGATGLNAGPEALQALPGGVIEKLGVGAEMTRYDATPDTLTALARNASDKGVQIFDASLSADPLGQLGDSAKYLWDFGDGTTAQGRVVAHSYKDTGIHEVTLTVTKGGASDTYELIAELADPTLLSLRFGTGGLPDDISSYDAAATLEGKKVAQANGSLHLQDGNYVNIDRDATAQLHALDDFTLTIDLQRDSASAGTGRILQITKSWGLSMDGNGRVVFEGTNNAGKDFSLVSTKAITDTKWHEVAITYDAGARLATIEIDGADAGSVAITGSTPSYSSYGLMVGWPWGSNFNGNIRAVDIVAGTDPDSLPALVSGTGGSAPVTEPAPAPAPEPEPAPAPEPAPKPRPEAGPDSDHSAILRAIESGDYLDLASSQSKTLVTDGRDGSGDDVVLADATLRFNSAVAKGGDNILIGDDDANWLVDGPGDDLMYGGDGADDFRFNGADSRRTDVILDLDFSEGDDLRFIGFDKGTFSDRGAGSDANAYLDGSGAGVFDLGGLAALAAASPDFDIDVAGEDVMLVIAQGADTRQIELHGFASDWQMLG